MGNQDIEFQVRLGLQGAMAQVAQLKKSIQESVNPKTDTYSKILNFLDKIGDAADNLQGKLSTAFKTSQSSKSFLKEYEKLLGMFDTAKDRISHIGIKDLNLSKEDQTVVNNIIDSIKNLEKEIATLEKERIGNIFDNSTEAGAERIRKLINELGLDVNKLTFSKLSSEINKQMNTTREGIDNTKNKINELQQRINSLSGDQLITFTDKIQQALATSTTKSTFKSENLLQYTDALKAFYDQYQGYTGKQGSVKAGGDISRFIDEESNRIRDGIAKMREQIPEYQKAIDELKALRNSKGAGAGTRAKEQAAEIGKQFGITGDASKTNWLSFIKDIQQQLEQSLKAANLGETMLNNLKGVFDGLDMQAVINPDKLQSSLKSIFTEALGADALKDINIASIFTSITKDIDFTTFMNNARVGITNYIETLRQNIIGLENEINKLEEDKAKLQEALNLNDSTSGMASDEIKQKEQAIEDLNKVLEDMLDKYRKAGGLADNFIPKQGDMDKARSSIESYIHSLTALENKQKALSNVSMAVDRWMGFWQVLNLTKSAINSMKQHIQELDTVMTKIAVVTNMTQNDLWGQIGHYSELARQYGVAIKGVYEVSQIYYQQGLQQGEVMNLTQETLKMARIAGIDYATAADYMTTAIRGFKLEMTDAAHVTDVFSALAANTASSTEELATAISKTAASAASVGASFEATSAMMATMIATTRESATNIGTALKSIISRYGEMKENLTGTDAEGEEYSLNKVDKALQTVGITIHDAAGQFRDFDDVILELAEAWGTIDKNTQRYIATVMAGNRQQSRFLALVSNVEEYKRALEIANNSENAGELQMSKTLDSVDAKLERMKVTVQEFYTSSGIQDLYKGLLDTITNVISGANALPKIFGKFPTMAITLGLQLVSSIKNILKLIIVSIKNSLDTIGVTTKNKFSEMPVEARIAGEKSADSFKEGFLARIKGLKADLTSGKFFSTGTGKLLATYGSTILSTVGSGFSLGATSQYGASNSASQDRSAAMTMGLGGLTSGAGGALSGAMMGAANAATLGPHAAIIGGALGFISGALPSLVSAFNMFNVTLARQLELDAKRLTEARQEETKAKGTEKELDSALTKLNTLKESSYSSAEALQEYIDYQNQLGDTYPNLIKEINELGNVSIDATALENSLARARTAAAEATLSAIQAEQAQAVDQKASYDKVTTALNIIDEDQLREKFNNTYSDEATLNRYWRDLGASRQKYVDQYNSEEEKREALYKYWRDYDSDNNPLLSMQIDEAGSVAKQLIDTLQKLQDENKSLNIAKQFGITDYSGEYNLDGIFTYTGDQIIELNNRVYKWAQDKSNAIVAANRELSKQTTYFSAQTEVNKRFEQMDNTTRNKYLEANYDSLITKLISRQYDTEYYNENGGVNFSTGGNIKTFNAAYERWLQWILTNADEAQILINELDVSEYKTIDELKAKLTELKVDDGQIVSTYESDWKKAMTDLNKQYQSAIKNYLDPNNPYVKSLSQLFDQTIDDTTGNLELSTKFIPYLQKQFKNIKELNDKGYKQAAQNYTAGLYEIYMAAGKLNEQEDIDNVSNILSSVDFQDSESIKAAIKALEEYGDDYADIIAALKNADNRLTANVSIQAQQLSEKTQELSTSIDKALAQMGKGMSYADALKEATAIYEALSDEEKKTSSISQFYAFDNELGQYVLTNDAITTKLSQLTTERDQEIKDINLRATRQLALISKIRGRNISTDSEQIINEFAREQGLLSSEKSGFVQQMNEWYAQAYQQGISFEEYLNNLETEIIASQSNQIKIAEDLLQSSALAYLASYDFKAIAEGTSGTYAKENLQTILKQSGIEDIDKYIDTIWAELINGKFNTLNSLLVQNGLSKISTKTQEESTKAVVTKYQTAIGELLNYSANQPVSEATKKLMQEAKTGYYDLSKSSDAAINAATSFLRRLESMIDGATFTLEQYNTEAKSILDKTLGLRTTGKTLLDFASDTIDSNSLEDLANSLNLELTDFVNVTTGEVQQQLYGLLKFDTNTGTYEIISKTFDDFINELQQRFEITIDKTSEQYIAALKAYNDKAIEKDHKVDKAVAEELNQLPTAKAGDRYNLTEVYSALQVFEKADMQNVLSNLKHLGAVWTDGILTITNEANIDQIISLIATEAQHAGVLIPEQMANLVDALDKALANIAGLISSGISGKLSNTDKLSLENWAGAYGIKDLEFTRTVDGLKLSQKSAIELYNKLKDIDAIQAELVFAELNKSLQAANEHYKNISDIVNRIAWIEDKNHPERAKQYAQELALAKEIYAVRSTTEDSSFNFMSNDIPGAQKNPINYYENWAKAIKTVNDALKTKGTYTRQGKTVESGFIDYQDWYNIVTEMNNIAKLGGDIKFAGETLDGSLEAASKLIEKGAASLVATDTGEIKVALQGMELDFSSGADAFADGVTDGIQAMAKSQVKMLNGMIKLMETIVAMEKLSDIDAAKDGHLDLSDLFPDFTVDSKTNTAKLGNLEAFNKFVAVAGDSLETISINGENLKDMIKRAQTSGLNKSEAQNFTNIMDSLYQMYLSGDYNLSSIYESIRQIAEASGFEGTIQLGDSTVVFKAGKIITKIDKNTWVDAEGNKYSSEKEALQGAQKLLLQNAAKEADGNIQLNLDNNEFTVTLEGSSVKFTINDSGDIVDNEGNTYSSLDAYLSEHYKTLMEEENYNIEELKIHLGLKVIPEIDAENGLTEDQIARLRAAKIKSYDDLKKAWDEDQSTGKVQFKAKYGISLGENEVKLTEEQIQQINEQLADKTETITMTVVNEEALAALKAVEDYLDALDGRHVTSYVDVKESNSTTATATTTPKIKKPALPLNKNGISYLLEATGNVGLAKAKGTLLGELGPELVVSSGHYFVAGQNGAEFVNLDTDAIVFNHLQTKALLEKGMSNSRGKAVTSEKNAISYATGNVNGGPAKASASAALAALKQLRAQWQALAGLSVKDLASKAGGGGGGGGGNNKQFIKDLERWYNWLQEIAKLEKKINYEESLRSKMQGDFKRDGREYFDSQMKSLEYLKREIQTQKDLVKEQTVFFKQRREELNSSKNPFSQFWTYDEEGQIKYTDKQFTYNGQTFNGGFEALAEINKTDAYGNQVYNADQQLAMMTAFLGKDVVDKYRKDADGKERESADILEAMWSSAEGNNAEMQGLFDSIQDGENAILDYSKQQNDILHEIEDNQIAVEDKVLKAIEDTRQREIDELQKERDAIEESSKNLIDGLSNQLQKERDMYSRQKENDELEKLQRRLAILQRSGGSASQIAGLQSQITDQMQDKYFDEQEKQINTLQEASDNQLARLDQQIDLMTEQLAYEKENGLLWNQVYEQMGKSPEEIAAFIHQNDSQYWSESPVKSAQSYRETLFQAEQFEAFRDKVQGGLDTLIAENSDEAVAEESKKITEEAEKKFSESTTANETNASIAPTANSGGTNASGKNSNKKKEGSKGYKVTVNNQDYFFDTQEEATSFRNNAAAGYGRAAGNGYSTIADAEKRDELINKSITDKVSGISQKKTIYIINNTEYETKAAAEAVKKQKIKDMAALEKQRKNNKEAASLINAATNALNYWKNAKITTKEVWYDRGGMVDETGPAILHAKEGVLTADQTSILRNDILGNKPNSLLNLLMDFRDAYERIPSASAYDSIGTSTSGIVIENATVEMNVSKLANDYDAQRAGEQALEKMLQIARKTSAQNRIGR